jgi:hypothetical protein
MIARVPNRIRTQKRANDTSFVAVAMSSASFSSEHASVSGPLRYRNRGLGFFLELSDILPRNIFLKSH